MRVTSKIPGRHHGYDDAVASTEESLRTLGLDHLDLHLIHWPNPRVGKYVEAWRALVDLRERGLVRSVGVSNFTEAHLQRIIDDTGVTPAVNQIELHPYFPQEEMRSVHEQLGIHTEAWSPMGKRQAPFAEPPVAGAAERTASPPDRSSCAGTSSSAPCRSRSPATRSVSGRTWTSSASSSTPTRWPPSPGWGAPTAGCSAATPTPTRRCSTRRSGTRDP